MSDTCYEQSLLSIKAACSFAHLPIHYRHESFHISSCWLFAEVRVRYRFLSFFFSLSFLQLRTTWDYVLPQRVLCCRYRTPWWLETTMSAWTEWLPRPVKVHDLRYTSAHCNLGNPPSKKKTKETAQYFLQKQRINIHISRQLPHVYRCCDVKITRQMDSWPSAFALIDMPTHSNTNRRKQALT